MMITDAGGPCGIRGTEDKNYTVIIMPMIIYDETEMNYSETDV